MWTSRSTGEAQDRREKYNQTFRCLECRTTTIGTNLATPGADVTTEDMRLLPHTRPDIVVRDSGEAKVIGIVVTHDLKIEEWQIMNMAEYRRRREQEEQERQEQEAHLGRSDYKVLIDEMMESDPDLPREPIRVPFKYLTSSVRYEARSLTLDDDEIVEFKLCSWCGGPAILYRDLVKWTGVDTVLGVTATVTHKECLN